MSSDERSHTKRFSGEDLDGREYRRWRLWVEAKLASMKDMSATQRGPFVFCLLDGVAMESVEHLSLEQLKQENGDKHIWAALDSRFPDRQKHDWMAECLREIFSLSASEGESMVTWTARVQEVFAKCRRKVAVTFPEEAQGWICLHASGLSEDQRAIVTAKTQGELKFDVVTAAMRSCFPDYRAPAKTSKVRSSAALLLEHELEQPEEDTLDAFETGSPDELQLEVEAFLSEHGALPDSAAGSHGEVFDEAEVAEVLAATWKEKRMEIAKLQKSRRFGQVSTVKKQFGRDVADLKKRSRCHRCHQVGHWQRDCPKPPGWKPDQESKKSGVAMVQHFSGVLQSVPEMEPEQSVPEFQLMEHQHVAPETHESLLVSSPGYGIIDSGCGRTLIGQETLNSFMRLFHELKISQVHTRKELNLFKFGNGQEETSDRVVRMPVAINGKRGFIEAAIIKGTAPLLLSRKAMSSLKAILDFNSETLCLEGGKPQKLQINEAGQYIINVLQFEEEPKQESATESFAAQHLPVGTISKKQDRALQAQKDSWTKGDSKCLVAELFSPPRFSAVAKTMGETGLSFDIVDGWDLTSPSVQKKVDQQLREAKPELLVACPECKHWGGWYRINQHKIPMLQQLQNRRTAIKQADFVADQIKKQLRRGGRVLVEHPWSSGLWKHPPMAKVLKEMHLCRTDLCAYDLIDPDSKLPILKPTGVAVSHEDMKSLALQCPGHQCHKTVEGRCADGENLSSKTARYTPKFCRHWLSCVRPSLHLCHFADFEDPTTLESEALAAEDQTDDDDVRSTLKRLHNNLGHPSDRDLSRVVKNAGGTSQAIRLASSFSQGCEVCKNRQRPTPCLPASVNHATEFGQRVGFDVKQVPGWGVNQKVKCLNIVDYASSFQVMVPFFETETAEVLHQLFRDRWLAWAGPPVEVVVDPARTTTAMSIVDPLESAGIRINTIAAEAHNQLGKVEKHGHLFELVLSKVLEQIQPKNRTEFEMCITQTMNAKNELINNKGLSPAQLVFGRNPRVPSDLLQEQPCVVASTAPLHCEVASRSQAIRASARTALVMSQDDITLRTALNARPRAEREFVSGDYVCYWRTQKYQKGIRLVGGRWFGTAIVMGRLGRNLLIYHRKNMFKVAPEHLRHASTEEKLASQIDTGELKGISELVEKQGLLGHQFVDLTGQQAPPSADSAGHEVAQQDRQDFWLRRGNQLCRIHRQQRSSKFMPEADDPVVPNFELEDWRLTRIPTLNHESIDHPWTNPDIAFATVGEEPWTGETIFNIIRDRPESKVTTAIGVPDINLFEETSEEASDSKGNSSTEGRSRSEPFPSVGETKSSERKESPSVVYGPVRARQPSKSPPSFVFRPPGTLQSDFIEMINDSPEEVSQHSNEKRSLSREPSNSPPCKSLKTGDECLVASSRECLSKDGIEVLLANFLQKKMQKELHHSRNEPELQEKIDASKLVEWKTLEEEKKVIQVVPPHEAAIIRKKKPDRIMSSRFVITEKTEDEDKRIKSRWCLRGHHDPDLITKILAGKCHSPTLSQLARNLVLQLIVSHKWTMNLGDIKGAFLEADVKEQASINPVYSELPPGGVPGVKEGSLVLILGNIYGANDAPHNWYKEFDKVALESGFVRSKFDSCLYLCFSPSGILEGIMGAHVDDTITGGAGETYDRAIASLRSRFPFRKWRSGEGEFLGTLYKQDPHTFEISYQQREYAVNITPIKVSRERARQVEFPATTKEIAALRAVNGALGWVSSQSRPDLCVQTSLSQQVFPHPTVHDLLTANQAVRRARQQADLHIKVPFIPVEELTVCFWSDAAFANTHEHRTQGGWLIGLTSKEMSQGSDVPIGCLGWKSYRLPRVVSSTVGGEAQAFATASGIAEWSLLLLAECLDGTFSLDKTEEVLKRRKPIGMTDCRSLYDHLISLGSGGTLDDKRTAIDIAIIRQSIQRCGLEPRWVPTDHMVADGLTKDKAEPCDLLRSVLRNAKYQLADEQTVLDRKKEERENRKRKAASRASVNGKSEVEEHMGPGDSQQFVVP